MNYYKSLLARYKECLDEKTGEHIWGLDREVLDGFRDYMFETNTKDTLLARANRLKYTGTDDEKLEQLARLDHDNLAINGEIALKATAKEQYNECALEEAEFTTPNYYVINPYIYG